MHTVKLTSLYSHCNRDIYKQKQNEESVSVYILILNTNILFIFLHFPPFSYFVAIQLGKGTCNPMPLLPLFYATACRYNTAWKITLGIVLIANVSRLKSHLLHNYIHLSHSIWHILNQYVRKCFKLYTWSSSVGGAPLNKHVYSTIVLQKLLHVNSFNQQTG